MSKEKTKTDKLRKPYYELSDGVTSFKLAVTKVPDEKLKKMAAKMQILSNEISAHLNKNYLWD